MTDKTYEKLTGKQRRWFQFSQLWLADDHLMMLKSRRFTEEYSRYGFKDIEAIVVTEIEPEPVRQVLMGLLALSAFVAASLIPDSPWAKGFFSIPAGLALAYVVADVLRGRKCRCLLRTAVSEHILEPLTRMKEANRVLAVLLPALQSAQGTLETVPAEMVESHALGGNEQAEKKHGPLVSYLLLGALTLNIIVSLAVTKWDTTQLATVGLYLFSAEWMFSALLYRRRPRFGLPSSFYTIFLPGIFFFLGADTIVMIGYFGYYFGQLAKGVNPKVLNQAVQSWPHFWEATLFSVLWRMAASILTFIHLRSEE